MEIGWVDFSKDDRKKVYDVVALLGEKGAVDEMGLGVVRDAFSNYFFPGTSTVQTRAKYFIIVPHILKEVVEGERESDFKKILKKIDDKEKLCGEKLLYNCKNFKNKDISGIIGQNVLPNNWVVRTPSLIYWSGIRIFGIFKQNLSIAEYIREYIKLKNFNKNEKKCIFRKDNDDGEEDDVDSGLTPYNLFWNLPIFEDENWINNLHIDLTKNEAQFLKTQICNSVKNSTIAYILNKEIDLNKYDNFDIFAEDLIKNFDVNDEMKDLLKLAQDFNKFVYIARIRYNVMLKNEDAKNEWENLKNQYVQYANVDLEAIFEKLKLENYPKTYEFLKNLQAAINQGNIEVVDDLIFKREKFLKKSRAKLSRIKEFEGKDWIGGKWLDYRFFDARRIVNDIYTGIKSNV